MLQQQGRWVPDLDCRTLSLPLAIVEAQVNRVGRAVRNMWSAWSPRPWRLANSSGGRNGRFEALPCLRLRKPDHAVTGGPEAGRKRTPASEQVDSDG